MKIQCDVCEKLEAALLCCADEAALCWGCDEKVHAANKLAGKHQRVPLLLPDPSAPSSSSHLPTCDICQEKAGYFFCLEDRALLCRNCDVAVHTASLLVSSHQRFLITGVRVALQHYLTNHSSGSSSSNTSTTTNNNNSCSNDKNNSSSSNGNSSKPLGSLATATTSIANKKLWAATTGNGVEEVEGLKAQWPWNELFDDAEFEQCYGISQPGSSSL